jgi:hypothetical protein
MRSAISTLYFENTPGVPQSSATSRAEVFEDTKTVRDLGAAEAGRERLSRGYGWRSRRDSNPR